jgi:hypothetical protein
MMTSSCSPQTKRYLHGNVYIHLHRCFHSKMFCHVRRFDEWYIYRLYTIFTTVLVNLSERRMKGDIEETNQIKEVMDRQFVEPLM